MRKCAKNGLGVFLRREESWDPTLFIFINFLDFRFVLVIFLRKLPFSPYVLRNRCVWFLKFKIYLFSS